LKKFQQNIATFQTSFYPSKLTTHLLNRCQSGKTS
jgi:hypothetical protein